MKRTGFNSKRKRTERARFERGQQWRAIAERDNWTCQTCHCSIHEPGCKPEAAHKIAETLSNITRFGYEVIDHPLNKALTCGRRGCNDAQNIGFKTMAAQRLAGEIRVELVKESEQK